MDVLDVVSNLVVALLTGSAVVFAAMAQGLADSSGSALEEGTSASPGDPLAFVSGPARGILTAERTALNFVGRMSGIATTTRDFVQRVAGTGAEIVVDTVDGMTLTNAFDVGV